MVAWFVGFMTGFLGVCLFIDQAVDRFDIPL